MKKLIIIGASGFGREVAWLVERINKVFHRWDLLGFLDDNEDIQNSFVNGYPVLGSTYDVKKFTDAYFVCAVGSSRIREMIITRILSINPEIKFATIIDPTVEKSRSVNIGEGSIICAHSILTVNIEIKKHVIINLDCTVGHDSIIDDFVTLYPSVNISGTCKIAKCSELGTGMQMIQGKQIGEYTIIGAGSVIIRDIPSKCTAVGNPAKPIKYYNV